MYLTNSLIDWEICLDILGTASVFEVRHKYVANDLNILNMASMCF